MRVHRWEEQSLCVYTLYTYTTVRRHGEIKTENRTAYGLCICLYDFSSPKCMDTYKNCKTSLSKVNDAWKESSHTKFSGIQYIRIIFLVVRFHSILSYVWRYRTQILHVACVWYCRHSVSYMKKIYSCLCVWCACKYMHLLCGRTCAVMSLYLTKSLLNCRHIVSVINLI